MSPTAVRQFNKIQIGLESAKGTLVAAIRELVGNVTQTEEQDFYRSDYPRGSRARPGGAGQIVRKGSLFVVESELTAEEILWPLSTGILGAVTPAGVGADKTWTFTPGLSDAVPTLDSATLEYMRSDGVTNHYAGEAGYCMTSQFAINVAFNEIITLNYSMFGRARQTTTPTPALTPYAAREPLIANLAKLFWDTTWAGLGTTQLATIIRSLTLTVDTGVKPDYTVDGRSDKDLTKHLVDLVASQLSVVLEFDATGAARFANYRANDLVMVRLDCLGSVVGSAVRTVRADGVYRFTSAPSFSEDGEQVIMTANLESTVDTLGNSLDFVVINVETAL